MDRSSRKSLEILTNQPILHQTSIVQTITRRVPASGLQRYTDPYPNPTASRTRIDITLPESAPVVMELVSLGGQVVRREAFNDLSEGLNPIYLDVSNLPFGVFQLRFIHQDGVTMKRLLVRN